MKVTLINHTMDAVDVLLFTKSTRLNMSPSLLSEIAQWPHEKKMAELAYMAETIPSSWEFVDYTFLVEGVSRAYTHQQVRTRAASYAQQTLRVLDVSGGFEYVWPKRLISARASRLIRETLDKIRETYAELVQKEGLAPEDARGLLPTNIATNIVCKFNLRTMSELAASRTGGRTQGEYRDVVNDMCSEVLRVHPWAQRFLFPQPRDYYAEIEAFAEQEFGGDLLRKGKLLKIVDKMRKER